MKLAFLVLCIAVGFIASEENLKIEIVDIHGAYGSETEVVNIDVKHKNTETNTIDDTEIQVQIFFHLVNNQVHCNGVPLQHNKVTHLHMQMKWREIHEGSEDEIKDERNVPVELRIFVGESIVGGKTVLIVEQQFLMIEDKQVEQIIIKKVMWENYERKPTVDMPYHESQLSTKDTKDDMHVHRVLPAHLPGHPYSATDQDDRMYYHHHHGHHHHHHHGIKGIRCWFKHLHKRSKIAVLSAGFLLLLSLIFAVGCCLKKRQAKRKTLHIESPLDDSIDVEENNEKKDMKPKEEYDFHFEVDNAVVVDDKKELIN